MEQMLDISVGVGGLIVAIVTILIVRYARVGGQNDKSSN
jgi:hypothetical protein